MMQLAAFMQMAFACAPSAAPETLAAIARTESGFDPYAIYDNSAGISHKPTTLVEAATLASSLIDAGHSVDVGLMQVNSSNFQHLGMTVVQALDPCKSLAAGAKILASGYQPQITDAGQQHALRVAISRYNTGDAARGFINGYVKRVEASAMQIVPAIRPNSEESAALEHAAEPPKPPQPIDIVDMLHGTNTPLEWSTPLANLLGAPTTVANTAQPEEIPEAP